MCLEDGGLSLALALQRDQPLNLGLKVALQPPLDCKPALSSGSTELARVC